MLLASGEAADVTLRCGGENFSAHRVVLCARSSAFKAMLMPPKEAKEATVSISVPESIDASSLRRMLAYIYTGELEPLSSAEEAHHLLTTAVHYCVPRLVDTVSRVLMRMLSVENAAATLTLAEMHHAAALKDAALRFVARNGIAVMATDGWALLKTASASLMEEVLHTVIAGAPPAAAMRKHGHGSFSRSASMADVAADGEAREALRRRLE